LTFCASENVRATGAILVCLCLTGACGSDTPEAMAETEAAQRVSFAAPYSMPIPDSATVRSNALKIRIAVLEALDEAPYGLAVYLIDSEEGSVKGADPAGFYDFYPRPRPGEEVDLTMPIDLDRLETLESPFLQFHLAPLAPVEEDTEGALEILEVEGVE